MRYAITQIRSLPSVMPSFYAGWMGHYVADAANPLHTTVNYNGWTGANPNGYTTDHTIHWKMEGVFVAANFKQLPFADLVPAQARKLDDPFQDYLAYLQKSHGYVEQVYQLEKGGGFDGSRHSCVTGVHRTAHGCRGRDVARPLVHGVAR